MRTYAQNTRIRSTVTFRNAADEPVDPTDVVFFLADPAGDETSYTTVDGVAKIGTGEYTYDFLLDQSGIWTYRWEGTGAVEVSSDDVRLLVSGSLFFPPP